jgi:hypothetical protein
VIYVKINSKADWGSTSFVSGLIAAMAGSAYVTNCKHKMKQVADRETNCERAAVFSRLIGGPRVWLEA